MERRFKWLLCVLTQLLLPGTFGQLTGTITSPGNPFIITATIVNPTTSTIAILAWNNIFDNATQLPVSFSVFDEQNNPVQLASTYAMRAGMTNDDFYDLLPGQNLTRTFDLRQSLQNIPSGPTTRLPKVVKVQLPLVLKGIVHSGSYQIPPAAAADFTVQPPRFGDFSAAGLQDINLSSKPFKRTLYFPIFVDLETGYHSPPDGIHVQTADCQAQNFSDLSNAIFDAGVYAKSVYLAANNATSTLFADFFNAEEHRNVSEIGSLLVNATSGSSPHVDIYYTDGLGLCSSESNILGYSSTPSWLGDAFITLCPSARNLGRAPAPCSTGSAMQLGHSASHVMFHLLLTLNNVVRTMIDSSVYGSPACQQLRGSLTWDPRRNADTYVQLAIAHWAYGLGGSPYNGVPCYSDNAALPNIPKRTRSLKPRRKDLDHSVSVSRQIHSRHVARQDLGGVLGQIANAAQQCTRTEQQLLRFAAQNARSLAASARDNPYDVLWTQYFNGDATVKAKVSTVFDNIAKWDSKSNAQGISVYCDPLRQTETCYSGRIAKIDFNAASQAVMVLCPAFFYYPASNQCLNPAKRFETQGADIDQAGTLLHELSHVPWINNKLTVADGYLISTAHTGRRQMGCYDFDCATALAAQRDTPGSDARNLPEKVASNYELYAYAVRASLADCSWTDYGGSAYGFGLGRWVG